MNCRVCGTQLPAGATHCPECGAATSYYSSETEAAPDDPTYVSAPETVAPPPPPSTLYGSPSYRNPYEPSSQRSGRRVGLIVGVLVLVLLLIGGGVFAWFASSSARNAGTVDATATMTAQAQASATANAKATPQTFPAKGTLTIVSRTNNNVRQDGQDKIYSSTVQAVDSGDIMGSYTSEEISTVHTDNSSSFTGKSTCICTVSGKSGTLKWSYTGTQAADGSFQGRFFDIVGTGDLAKLHGQGVFQGQGDNGTYSSDLYFDA